MRSVSARSSSGTGSSTTAAEGGPKKSMVSFSFLRTSSIASIDAVKGIENVPDNLTPTELANMTKDKTPEGTSSGPGVPAKVSLNAGKPGLAGLLNGVIVDPDCKLSLADIKDNGDGNYDIGFSPKQPGIHLLYLLMNGNLVRPEPFYILVGSGSGSGSGARTFILNFPVKDASGKPIGGLLDKLSAKVTDPDGDAVEDATVENGEGDLYAVRFTAAKDGPYQIAIFMDGKPVFQQSMTPQFSSQSGNGKVYVLRFPIVDASGKPVTGIANELSAKVKDPNGDELEGVSVEDAGDGDLYAVKFPVDAEGEYEIAVFRNGKPVFEKKMSPQFGAVSGSGPRSFIVRFPVNDASGKPVKGLEDKLSAKVTNPDGDEIEGPVIGTDGDVYTVQFTPNKPGEYLIAIFLDGKQIFKQSMTPQFKAVSGAGPRTFTLKFPVNDASGNFVSGLADKLNATVKNADDEELEGVTVGDVDGEDLYAVNFTADKPGLYQIGVTMDGKPVFQQAFRPRFGGASAGPKGVGKTSAFTHWCCGIQVCDAEGNPKTTGGDDVRASVAGPQQIEPSVTDLGAGKYRISMKPTTPGEYAVSIFVNDEEVNGSPYKLTIKK